MDTRSRFAASFLVLTQLLASCGGSGDSAAPVAATPTPAGPTPPDTQAPTITLTAPANLAANLSGTVGLAATAADNVGVASVEFQVDGIALGAADTAAPYAASLDTTQYAAGQHIVRARARDAAGNLSTWSSATVTVGGSAAKPAGFTLNNGWITSLNGATAFAQLPDGRMLVAQQGGTLALVRNGAVQPTPFLQLTVDSTGERGLIGVAAHPNFASNGFVYVYYTSTAGGSHNRISRFVASGDVSTGAETVLVDLPNLSSATNHNGGALHFGGDGKLYLGVGDNANSAQAPDLTKVFGKLLRFNDDGTIPSDNPFFSSTTGLARAIWAYGLRNPFTFAVQPGTGRIHINDVGENTWEEVDVGSAGANYGWPASEGFDGNTAGVTLPLFTYKHSATTPPGSGPGGFFTGIAIAGGTFYPSSGPFPAAYQGNYFFADFGSRVVARLDLTNNAAYAFGTVSDSPVDMLTGLDGALYVLGRSSIAKFSAP